MAIDRDIIALVRKESAKIKPTITADDLFTSNEFSRHISALVDTTTGKYSNKINVELIHMESDMTACTDGRGITQNTRNSLVYGFESLYNKYLSQIGMTMHEIAHIIFCNFDEENAAIEKVRTGEFYGISPVPTSDEEEEQLEQLIEAMNEPQYRCIFEFIYHHLSNIVSDPHDEDKLIDSFGSFIFNSISMIREGLKMSIPSIEEMMDNPKIDSLSIMFNLLLQYARFGEFVTEDFNKAVNLEPVKKLIKLAPVFEKARFTDDTEVKFSCLNQAVLFLWPYIKEKLEEFEENKNDESNSGESNDSKSGNSSNSSGSNTSQKSSAAQSVLEKLKSGAESSGQTNAPENVKTSKEAKKNSKEAKEGKQSSPSNSAKTDKNDSGEDMLSSVLDAIANSKAEKNVQDGITSNTNAVIKAINQNGNHANIRTYVSPQTNINNDDIRVYNSLMNDLKGYSRRLQKQMRDALRDLRDGDVSHRKLHGNRLEAKNAYRPDQRFYANKKLPQDLPEMAISILVDHSGSMHGERINASMKASMLLYDFATSINIPVAVAGHNVRISGQEITYYTYTDFRKVSDNEKYRLAKMKACSCNRDGAALEIAANLLARRPEEVKLLIIISDGQPNDHGYGGEGAATDLKEIVRKYKKQGVETIAAAIGSDKERIKEIYGEGSFIDIEDLDKFPKTLVSLVKKRIIN